MTKGLKDPTADVRKPDIGTDPALIAARAMKALDDEFAAMMATPDYREDDEKVVKSKKWLGTVKKSTGALERFADAIPTTPAGLLEKLRYVEGELSALYKDDNKAIHFLICPDTETVRHLRSAIAYVERLAPGTARILAE